MRVATTPTADEVEASVRKVWSFDGPTQLPTPNSKGPVLRCGTCGHNALLVRSWRLFTRGGDPPPTHPYRCDVATKCGMCSALTWFGVVVPRDVWDEIPRHVKGLTIKRTEAIARGWVAPQEDGA